MVSGSALLCAALAVGLIVISGFWAEHRFKQFAKLPAHFDFSGNATRLASRSFVIWLTPAIFVSLICLIVVLFETVPPEELNGNPNDALIWSSVIILGTQAFILWSIDRWSRAQA